MSTFKERTDYFKNIAMANKLVAHNLLDESTGNRRNSFFRINDEEELNSAVVDYGHFPCIVHMGFEVRFKTPAGAAMPHKSILNTIWFLSKPELNIYLNKADAIEAAYDESYKVLTQFVSFLLMNDDCCCSFDFETAQTTMIGPELNDLYGWQLQIQDSKDSNELRYNPADWLGNPDEQTEEQETILPEYIYAENDAEIIPFAAYESEKIIDWNNTRKARFGTTPTIEVWYSETDGFRLSTSTFIQPDQLPPLATRFTIKISTPGAGVITIKP